MKNTVLIKHLLVAVVFITMFQTFETKAAWGDFDRSFGVQGVAVDQITGFTPRDVSLQPDGKILVTGYRITPLGRKGFFLRRYLSDGQPDIAFGKKGLAISSEPTVITSDYRGEKILVQTNGNIAVVGQANGYYAVWQITSSGKSDNTFGQNGLQVLTNYPLLENGSEFVINIHNTKLLLSLTKLVGNEKQLVLIRLNSGGSTDQTFGTFGESSTNLFGYGFGTVIESDGRITVGGGIGNQNQIGLERKLENGQIDLAFTRTYLTRFGALRGFARLANGKYAIRIDLVTQQSSEPTLPVLDIFSSNGIYEGELTFANGNPHTSKCPNIFTNQNDGKPIFTAVDRIHRLSSDLIVNTLETYNCSNLSGISSIHAAIQPDDKMVVVGTSDNYPVLVRILPD